MIWPLAILVLLVPQLINFSDFSILLLWQLLMLFHKEEGPMMFPMCVVFSNGHSLFAKFQKIDEVRF